MEFPKLPSPPPGPHFEAPTSSASPPELPLGVFAIPAAVGLRTTSEPGVPGTMRGVSVASIPTREVTGARLGVGDGRPHMRTAHPAPAACAQAPRGGRVGPGTPRGRFPLSSS